MWLQLFASRKASFFRIMAKVPINQPSMRCCHYQYYSHCLLNTAETFRGYYNPFFHVLPPEWFDSSFYFQVQRSFFLVKSLFRLIFDSSQPVGWLIECEAAQQVYLHIIFLFFRPLSNVIFQFLYFLPDSWCFLKYCPISLPYTFYLVQYYLRQTKMKPVF